MRRDSREDTGHSSALESKRSGTGLSATHLKENSFSSPHRWWIDSKKPVTRIQKHQCFESWNSENKEQQSSTHFNVDALNTELIFRTIHSANQLMIYGAVSSWCEEFGQKPNENESTSERFVAKENEQQLKNVKPQEVNSSVQTPESENPASGHRSRECLQRFDTQ